MARASTSLPRNFNPRAPCGARLAANLGTIEMLYISTHAPLAGRDRPECPQGRCRRSYFNPRAPCGARPAAPGAEPPLHHISTHAPLAGRDMDDVVVIAPNKISTHAPLAGRDRPALHARRDLQYFNPRAPCGARPTPPSSGGRSSAFQPTRPLRGATAGNSSPTLRPADFNPRAPCGARHAGDL